MNRIRLARLPDTCFSITAGTVGKFCTTMSNTLINVVQLFRAASCNAENLFHSGINPVNPVILSNIFFVCILDFGIYLGIVIWYLWFINIYREL